NGMHLAALDMGGTMVGYVESLPSLVWVQLTNLHRLSQRRGRRFELSLARKLRNAGLEVHLNDETTGYSRGVDLWVGGDPREGPAFAIQAKATKTESDLWRAFAELDCTGKNHWASGWVVVHSWRRPGKRPLIRARGRFRHGPMTQWE